MTLPTDTIRVRPQAVFAPEHSEPSAQRFAFSYEIVIENTGDQAVTLTDRHWVVDHGNGHLEDIHGQGVVGQQPRLRPGERFSYRSGAVIETAAGHMHGDYGFISAHGKVFRAVIPGFDLVAPAAFRRIH